MTPDDLVRRRARQLAAEAAASGDPAGWFETLYAEAREGSAIVPWDDGQPNPHLTEWAKNAAERGIAGPGRRTVENFLDHEDPPKLRWRAEFTRS
jgi:hypothetical protein